MPHLEPTYLRYIYDGLIKGSIHPENAAELPEGLIGLYEEAFDERTSVVERQKLLQRFAIWALLKKEVSAAFVAEILGETEDEIQDFISTYSSWFNSPESGKYQLYHERIKIYLLSKASSYEILALSNKVLEFLKTDLSISEHIDYKLRFYLDHLALHSYESVYSKEVLDHIVHQNDFWDTSFSVLKSTQPAIENIRNLILFSVYKQDWKLLYRCTQVILYMEQKNDSLCEQILKSFKLDIDEATFCFNSISSPLERLRFLTYLTIKIESCNILTHIDLNQFWDQLVNYVQTEYINGALIMPLWIKKKLQAIAENQQINALKLVMDEIDFDDVDPLSIAGIHKSFAFLEDESEMVFLPKKDLINFEKLKKALRTKSDNFSNLFAIISTPNLMDRDEMLCRASLDFIDFNHQKSYDWLYWLLVKSDFEWGGHASPDDKYYTKNLIAKFISKSDFSSLKKIEKLIVDIDLYHNQIMEIRCWISEKYYKLKNFKSSIEVLYLFKHSIQSSFDESEWKSAWFVSQNKNFNIDELHVSKRLDTVLKYPSKVQEMSFNDIKYYLKPIDTDIVSKAEYFLDTAVRIYKSRKKLAEELVNASWELIYKTSDWASLIVKVEIIATALNFFPESWINKKIKKITDEFRIKLSEYEWELNESLKNFYYYHPFRFSDQNILKLSMNSKAVRTFLVEFDEDGLENAIENEKIEKLISNKAKDAKNFRSFWAEVRSYFKADGVGLYIENFWSLFEDNKEIFQKITAEDVRIIGVISRKVGQHFPTELHGYKSSRLQFYEDRISIPNDWEYGSKKGFEAMLHEKTSDIETVCNAILNSPRNGNELTQTSINAVGYMLLKVLGKKELVKDVSAFLTLRNEILVNYA
jgi:hypothetical protein